MNMKTTSVATLSSGLVRAWVRLYTAGLPLEIKTTRLEEIESDLWEHECDAKAVGGKLREVALQVMVRWLPGIPDDLLWRFEQRATEQKAGERGKRRFTVSASLVSKGWLGMAVLIALLSIAVGVSNGVSAAEDSWAVENWGRSLAVIIPIMPAVAIAAGLVLNLRSRLFGGGLTLLGAVASGVILAWYIIVPVLAVLTLVLWVISLRAGSAARTRA